MRSGVAGFIAVVLVIAAIVGIVAAADGYSSTDGGHIAVVRNGGPFDNHQIRQIVPPGSGRTRTGLNSEVHNYPTSQRYYTISSDGKGDANASVTVPTADGVEVGIEGTAYFTVDTSSANNYSILKNFDSSYGTRKFKCDSGGSKDVWQGDAGFVCFLDQMVYPIIHNDLRTSIGSVRCADLVSSCSLVQNTNATIDPTKIGQGNVNLANVEKQIGSSLSDDLTRTLRGDYFSNVTFNLASIDLPKSIQDSIEKALSSFANVSQSQADLKKAQIEAQANEAKQQGYNKCPACQQIDIEKAFPPGVTVYAPGSGSGLGLVLPSSK